MALDKAHTSNELNDFVQLVVQAEEEALKNILALVDGRNL